MPNAGREGEERTAGSDPRIRFSSGGPISLDPEHNLYYFYTYLPFGLTWRKGCSLRGMGRGAGWGGGTGGGVVRYIYTIIAFNRAALTDFKNIRTDGFIFTSFASFQTLGIVKRGNLLVVAK